MITPWLWMAFYRLEEKLDFGLFEIPEVLSDIVKMKFAAAAIFAIEKN
jgi:hypothetical protein